MEFKTVGGHTFCPELLTDGVIIDVGCRGFEFADYFKGNGKHVTFCIDPDKDVFKDVRPFVAQTFMNVAISDKSGDSGIYINGEGTCLKEIDPDQSHPFIPCKTITMQDLYKITGENVDILKLDCEGAEYIILGETFKPIPKQISVEWHAHAVPEMHQKLHSKCHARLIEYYEVVNNPIWEKRHGCSENLWDVLYVRKDLIK